MAPTNSHTILADNPEPGIVSSLGRDWGCFFSIDAYHSCADYSVKFPGTANYMIAYMLSGNGRLEQTRGDRCHSATFRAENFLLRPAFQEAVWQGSPPAHSRLRLSSYCMERAWEELGSLPSRPVEVPSVFQARDPFFSRIVPLLLRELSTPIYPAQRLFVEASANLLIAHLIRSYCTFAAKPEPANVQLAPYLVRRICDYIEDHLGSTITLADLAEIAKISSFHLCRCFRESTGFTPMQFVERTRLKRAQLLIREGRLSLRAIAHRVGFQDQSHFSRRFRAVTHCTPSQFARHIRLDDDGPCELL